MRRLRPAHGAAGGDLAGGFHEGVLGGGFGAVDGGVGSVKGVGNLVGGFGGAQVAQWLPGPVLRAFFAVFVLYSSQRMLGVQDWVSERLRRGE